MPIMVNYNREPLRHIGKNNSIASFITENEGNLDTKTVESFGNEWEKFSDFDDREINTIAGEYFDIVTDAMVNKNLLALDIGCGSGRWSKYLSSKVSFVEAVDPSNAVFTAQKMLGNLGNVRVTQAGVDTIPFEDNSFDFVLSLGVFHHLPDTQGAINKAVKKIKAGGYLLLYLYYDLDNRGFLFKFLFQVSNAFRMVISSLPNFLKTSVCEVIAMVIYLPLVFLAGMVKTIFPNKNWYSKFPLSYYIGKSFKVIRNDALDRFGTPLEKRFSKKQITEMLEKAGLEEIRFSDNTPYWHSVARKSKQ
jgi:ubiquinone/menaquinone biosynthesis C-methylase UbiE